MSDLGKLPSELRGSGGDKPKKPSKRPEFSSSGRSSPEMGEVASDTRMSPASPQFGANAWRKMVERGEIPQQSSSETKAPTDKSQELKKSGIFENMTEKQLKNRLRTSGINPTIDKIRTEIRTKISESNISKRKEVRDTFDAQLGEIAKYLKKIQLYSYKYTLHHLRILEEYVNENQEALPYFEQLKKKLLKKSERSTSGGSSRDRKQSSSSSMGDIEGQDLQIGTNVPITMQESQFVASPTEANIDSFSQYIDDASSSPAPLLDTEKFNFGAAEQFLDRQESLPVGLDAFLAPQPEGSYPLTSSADLTRNYGNQEIQGIIPEVLPLRGLETVDPAALDAYTSHGNLGEQLRTDEFGLAPPLEPYRMAPVEHTFGPQYAAGDSGFIGVPLPASMQGLGMSDAIGPEGWGSNDGRDLPFGGPLETEIGHGYGQQQYDAGKLGLGGYSEMEQQWIVYTAPQTEVSRPQDKFSTFDAQDVGPLSDDQIRQGMSKFNKNDLNDLGKIKVNAVNSVQSKLSKNTLKWNFDQLQRFCQGNFNTDVVTAFRGIEGMVGIEEGNAKLQRHFRNLKSIISSAGTQGQG